MPYTIRTKSNNLRKETKKRTNPKTLKIRTVLVRCTRLLTLRVNGVRERCKNAIICPNIVDLKQCCNMSIYYLLAKTGLYAAENGPSKVPTRRPKSTYAYYA